MDRESERCNRSGVPWVFLSEDLLSLLMNKKMISKRSGCHVILLSLVLGMLVELLICDQLPVETDLAYKLILN